MRKLLDQGQIVIHPFVIAELAPRNLQRRAQTLALLDLLPLRQNPDPSLRSG
jgi:hypothetical protein